MGRELGKRTLQALLFPTWLVVGHLQAPGNVGIDLRPAARHRIVETVARFENCSKWRNPGCLKFRHQPGAHRGPRGFAVFDRAKHGRAALEKWWRVHECLPLERALGVYDPEDSGYADKLLDAAGLDGDLILGEECTE